MRRTTRMRMKNMIGTATAAASSESLSVDELEFNSAGGIISVHPDVSFVAPLTVPTLPTAHGTHSDELVSEVLFDQVFSGQSLIIDPPAQYDPMGQMEHADSADVPLGTDPYVPGTHGVHVTDDPADHPPAAHISLTDELVQYDPAAH